jgi:hypothetical protein
MPIELRGYIIHSQRGDKRMEKPYHTARVGLMFNKVCTDTIKLNHDVIKLQLFSRLQKGESIPGG